MSKSLTIVLALGAALLAAPAWPGERAVDERRPLKPAARVDVSNVAGRIEVEAWDRNELHLTGTLAPEVEQLIIDGDEAHLRIEVDVADGSRRVGETRLKLMVPARASVELEAVSADVSVKGLRGDVEVATVSGDIRLETSSRRIEAASVSGDVTLTGPSHDTEVASVSGNVSVRGAQGKLRGESVSGDVWLDLGSVDHLQLESVSGDIEVTASLGDAVEVSIETLSGNIDFALPRLPDGELEMETFSGELRSGLTSDLREGAKEYRQRGKGKSEVRLNSFSGDIELKKK